MNNCYSFSQPIFFNFTGRLYYYFQALEIVFLRLARRLMENRKLCIYPSPVYEKIEVFIKRVYFLNLLENDFGEISNI